MTLRTPRWLTIAIVLAAVVLTVTLVAVVKHSKAPQLLSSKSGAQTIVTPDGAKLSAYAFVPNGDGSFPLVVMPSSWGGGASVYAYIGADFAALGFVVVAYGQRGFGGSTGLVDFAGTNTRTDVSTVITWARAHLPTNDKGVGAVGVSYGGGISLLAAEHDPRITAVAALSGWSDFAQAFAPGGTVSAQVYESVFAGKVTTAQATPAIGRMISQFRQLNGTAVDDTVRQLSKARSPVSDVATLNKRHTAVMLASTYEDSIAPPADLINFYNRLTGPKRLELTVGDHGGSSLSGLLGKSNTLWVNVAKWVGRYLLGTRDGIDTEKPVQLQDATTQKWHVYPDWAATGHDTTSYLTGSTATISTATAGPWTRSITGGVDTVADVGHQQFTTGLPYQIPKVSIAAVSRSAGAVWNGSDPTSATLVSGVVRVHSAVTLTAPTASLFAYLYDVDGTGTGTLMTHGTLTVRGAVAGKAQDADIALQPVSWTVAAGHHLSLVLDTVDPRYLGQSVKGSTVTFTSTAGDPATITTPQG